MVKTCGRLNLQTYTDIIYIDVKTAVAWSGQKIGSELLKYKVFNMTPFVPTQSSLLTANLREAITHSV